MLFDSLGIFNKNVSQTPKIVINKQMIHYQLCVAENEKLIRLKFHLIHYNITKTKRHRCSFPLIFVIF